MSKLIEAVEALYGHWLYGREVIARDEVISLIRQHEAQGVDEKLHNIMLAHLDGVYKFSARVDCDELVTQLINLRTPQPAPQDEPIDSAYREFSKWREKRRKARDAKLKAPPSVNENALEMAIDCGFLCYNDTEGDLDRAITEAVEMYASEIQQPTAPQVSAEVVAMGMALQDYRWHGLETLVSCGEIEYMQTRWQRYLPSAQAALAAMQEAKP